MPSTLTWLDHDAAARERTRRILALFQEKGTQDQLGIGGIRDNLSDLLFPGTSTIQTRLRYFLIIPWVYTRMEEEGVPANRFEAEARSRELALIKPLVSSDEKGIFGQTAGGDLKRLPSEVYWAGLGSWEIRRFPGSRDEYHRSIDDLYRRRRMARQHRPEDDSMPPAIHRWHPELPSPPSTFPDRETHTPPRDEAEFLRDRIIGAHDGSLLAWLALRGERTDVAAPWLHPAIEAMNPEHRKTLSDARIFSDLKRGAATLYNLLLCRKAGLETRAAEYLSDFDEWASELDQDELQNWNLQSLLQTARAQGSYRVTPQTEGFVTRWLELVRSGPHALADDPTAHRLIEDRERLLKGARSLFRNRTALEQRYGGALGLGSLTYRWRNTQVLLNDLHDGLAGGI